MKKTVTNRLKETAFKGWHILTAMSMYAILVR